MEIAEVIRLHGLWLADQEGGKRADLTDAILTGAILTGAILTGAIIRWANLRGANLRGANLTGANLRGAILNGADLNGADLRGADLRGADLTRADLTGANLTRADLTGANLTGADLTRANLTDANLRGANLRGADLTRADLPPLKTVLPEGAFTAYKKVRGGVVLTLLIPADAARTGSLVGKKCRADRAKVVSASVEGLSFQSLYDHSFTYTVGEVVFEPNYDSDTRVECTDGIHFFMTREEAEAFTF